MDPENKFDESGEATLALVRRMDKTADMLLTLVENEKTSEVQKGRLFSQVLAWCKVRPTLVPSGEGGKLEEMGNAIKSTGDKRSGSAGSGAAGGSGSGRKNGDGHAIEAIIRSLPKPAHRRGAGGNQESIERSGGGAAGDGGRVPLDGSGNVAGNAHGAGDSAVV